NSRHRELFRVVAFQQSPLGIADEKRVRSNTHQLKFIQRPLVSLAIASAVRRLRPKVFQPMNADMSNIPTAVPMLIHIPSRKDCGSYRNSTLCEPLGSQTPRKSSSVG